MNWLVSNTSLKSILRASEGPFPASVTSNGDSRDDTFAGVDKNCNWNQEGVSMEDHGPLYSGAHTTLHLLAPQAFPGFYHPQAIAQCQEQTVSRETPQQSRKGLTAKPPKSPLRTDEKRGAPEDRHRCHCGLDYKQKSGLTRHYRDKHEFSLCNLCDFKWHRHNELEKHLHKEHQEHTGANISDILDKVTRSRREATKIETHRQRASLLTIEHAGGDCAETGCASLPSPAAVVSARLPARFIIC